MLTSFAARAARLALAASLLLAAGRPARSADVLVGTPAIVKDINPVGISSTPQELTFTASLLYMTADDGVHGRELWKSDGTANGTVMVKELCYASCDLQPPAHLTMVGTTLFFGAWDSETGLTGNELWKSDGTAAGTVIVKDILPGSASSSPNNLFAFGGRLVFSATTAAGKEPWISDGTANGTVMIKDVNPGAGNGVAGAFGVGPGGTVFYMSATDGVNGFELWKSDGTTNGTVLVKDIVAGSGQSSPSGFIATSTLEFFTATTTATGRELWKSDGTTNGTVLVKDINGTSADSSVLFPVALGSLLIFSANDGTNGVELWKSDGTTGGTVMLKDINPGSADSTPTNLTTVGAYVYFAADNGTQGRELWRTDGTALGTVLIKDINPGVGSSSPYSFASNGSTPVLFGADDGTHGFELWKTDGTGVGTVQIADLNPTGNSGPDKIAYGLGAFYFKATDLTTGAELWKTDGSTAAEVADINPGNGSSLVLFSPANIAPEMIRASASGLGSPLCAGDGVVVFIADDGSGTGPLLWQTKGTAETTGPINTYAYTFPNAAAPSLMLKGCNEVFFPGQRGGDTSQGLEPYIAPIRFRGSITIRGAKLSDFVAR